MTANILVSARSKPRDSDTNSSALGGTAEVEIKEFPQLLFTRSGDPEALFLPLLDAARESHGMLQRLLLHGESKSGAASLAGMNLASVLLRSAVFSIIGRGHGGEHAYAIDLAGDTLAVHTRLYAAVSRRAALFKVNISGKISGGPFTVQHEGQESVIVQVEEQNFRQPNFFSRTLPEECLRAQIEHQHFHQMEESLGSQNGTEVRLMVVASGRKIPALLRQKPGGAWQIIDGRTQEWIGTLPPEAENHLKHLTAHLEELFA
jgi:hypothetical protein